MASVEIALATFNSALFLRELLESLFRQTYQDFTLLVSDDGSTDSTLDIVAEFQGRYSDRIKRVGLGQRAGGACANFSRLIDHLTADYVLFCDHDDVWLPNKIALSLDRIRFAEAQQGAATPLLVHTNRSVVGPNLEELDLSVSSYMRINPARSVLPTLLIENTVQGCTTIINRALYERARPVPRETIMHDHWLALVAAALGKIDYIEESTLLYRVHGENVCAPKPWGRPSILKRVKDNLLGAAKRQGLMTASVQASVLLTRYGNDMTPEQREVTAIVANLWSVGRLYRFMTLLRHGVLFRSFFSNAGLLVAVSRRGETDASPIAR